MKYEKWLKEWLANYVEPSVKARTYDRYAEVVHLRISPQFGQCELSDLNPTMLQQYVAVLLKNGNFKTGKGLSANSVRVIINVMQCSLKTAYELGYVNEYIADKVKRPRAYEKEVTCFTSFEQKRIERAIISGRKTKMFGILLCLYSGLRIGELLSLEWEDLDLENGILTVSKSCHDGKDKTGKFIRITEPPKTFSSKRIIPLPKQMLPYLKTAKRKSTSALVVSSGGKILSVRSYQNSFALLLKRLDIPHKGFHALRHTFATRALECGMDVKTLSEILGHKSPMVTLNRYVHSLMEHKQEMMNRLGKLL